MTGRYSVEILNNNFDIILQYRNRIPMKFISFWNGGESWTGHLLIMKREDISIEKAFALFIFRSFCLFEECDTDDISDEDIKNIFNTAISEFNDNDIIIECSTRSFITESNYSYLIDLSKQNVLVNRSGCEITINKQVVGRTNLAEWDPLKEYIVKAYFQVKGNWNSKHYILVTDNEFIYYEGWTNA